MKLISIAVSSVCTFLPVLARYLASWLHTFQPACLPTCMVHGQHTRAAVHVIVLMICTMQLNGRGVVQCWMWGHVTLRWGWITGSRLKPSGYCCFYLKLAQYSVSVVNTFAYSTQCAYKLLCVSISLLVIVNRSSASLPNTSFLGRSRSFAWQNLFTSANTVCWHLVIRLTHSNSKLRLNSK